MAEGDIESIQDILIFDSTYGYHVSLVHVSGDVYAVAYVDSDIDGWLKTFTIDSAGQIGAIIDSFEFDGILELEGK